ncbi:PHP domain-containing protein [Methylobacterium sp. WL93]|nr:PHP domain-containing protein [Methylobacterium sp. WL93]
MARQLKEVGFVHLHVHSSYSLLEGALKVGDIVKSALADHQPALALTDTNNLFGALEFSEKAAGSGIQPIAGMQLSVAFEAVDPMARVARPAGSLVVLAQNETGYGNLLRLASRAYFDTGLGEAPCVSAAALAESSAGLIALTGGFTGPLDAALPRRARPASARSRPPPPAKSSAESACGCGRGPRSASRSRPSPAGRPAGRRTARPSRPGS